MSVEFAFGPAGSQSWFFESPTEWRMNNLPSELQAKFVAPSDVASTFMLVLGANGSFLMAYKRKSDGRSSIFTSGLPERLRDWAMEQDKDGFLVRDVDNLRIILGPNNDSYFATDGKRLFWSNLPDSLVAALNEMRGPDGDFTRNPRVVALGIDDNYIMISEGNGGSWRLPKYPNLVAVIQKVIKDAGKETGALKSIHYIWLDSHDSTDIHWVLMDTTNSIQGEVLDEAVGDAMAIIESFEVMNNQPVVTPQQPTARRPAGKKKSSGFGSLLKVANSIAKGLNGGGGDFGGGGGSGGNSGASFTDYSSGNNGGSPSGFWDPIQAAASSSIQ